MDDEHRVILIDDEDHLQQIAARCLAPHQPLIFFTMEWIGTRCPENDLFSLLWSDAMLCNVCDIPLIPSKFQDNLYI